MVQFFTARKHVARDARLADPVSYPHLTRRTTIVGVMPSSVDSIPGNKVEGDSSLQRPVKTAEDYKKLFKSIVDLMRAPFPEVNASPNTSESKPAGMNKVEHDSDSKDLHKEVAPTLSEPTTADDTQAEMHEPNESISTSGTATMEQKDDTPDTKDTENSVTLHKGLFGFLSEGGMYLESLYPAADKGMAKVHTKVSIPYSYIYQTRKLEPYEQALIAKPVRSSKLAEPRGDTAATLASTIYRSVPLNGETNEAGNGVSRMRYIMKNIPVSEQTGALKRMIQTTERAIAMQSQVYKKLRANLRSGRETGLQDNASIIWHSTMTGHGTMRKHYIARKLTPRQQAHIYKSLDEAKAVEFRARKYLDRAMLSKRVFRDETVEDRDERIRNYQKDPYLPPVRKIGSADGERALRLRKRQDSQQQYIMRRTWRSIDVGSTVTSAKDGDVSK